MSTDVGNLSHGETSPLKNLFEAIDEDEEKNCCGAAEEIDLFLLARSERWEAMMSLMKHPLMSPSWLWDLLSSGYFPLFSVGIMFHLEKLLVDAKWAEATVCACKLKKPITSWQKFDHDQTPKKYFQGATFTIIVLCIVLHVCRVILWGDRWRPSTEVDPLYTLLAQVDHGVIDEDPGFYRFFTSIFLHRSNTHLCLNMFSLWIYGTKMEHWHGPLYIWALLCLTGAASITVNFLIGGGSCGISGIVSCIRGAMCTESLCRNWLIRLEIDHEKGVAEKSMFKNCCVDIICFSDSVPYWVGSLLGMLYYIDVFPEEYTVNALATLFGAFLATPFALFYLKDIKMPLKKQQEESEDENCLWYGFIFTSLLIFCTLSYSASHKWSPPVHIPSS